MITLSLKQILAEEPCADGWAKVLYARGKITKEQMQEFINNDHVPKSLSKLADDDQFPLSSIIESNSLDDCLWALRCADEIYYPLMRKFAVWSARRAQHLMTDDRSIAALDVAWRHSDGLATDQELAAARAAAWDAEMDDVRAAAWADARTVARAAAMDDAWAAALATAGAAAGADERDAQAKKLKTILDDGHWVD
jgi:hypothetical protein